MAEIPSDIASSAAQAAARARQAANVRDAHNVGRAQAAQRHVDAVDDASKMVDTDDADSRVFADSEGTGSQGSPFEEETAQEPEAADEGDEGISRDDDGHVHLDLEA